MQPVYYMQEPYYNQEQYPSADHGQWIILYK
jgi:hypothetical protein